MKKFITLSILSIVLIAISYSQSPKAESVRNAIKKSNGINKVEALLEANQVLFAWKDKEMVDSTYYYAKAAYDLAGKIGYMRGKAQAARRLSGWAKLWRKNCTLSMSYAKEALFIAEQLKSDSLLGDAYFTYAGALQCEGNENNFDEVIGALKKGAAAYKAIGYKQGEGQAYWHICSMLSGKGSYEDGFDYCQNALTLTKAAANDSIGKSSGDKFWAHQLVEMSLLNIAHLYVAAGDFQTAQDYMRLNKNYQSIYTPCCQLDDAEADLYIKMKLPDSALNILNNWPEKTQEKFFFKNYKGQALLQKKEYFQAIKLFTEVLPEVKKDNKFHSYSKLLIDLGNAYSGIGNYDTALKYANEGLKEAEQYNIRPYLLEAYQVLSSIHKSTNNYKTALEYLEKYTKLKESILSNQFYWRLNNYKNSASDARKTATLALLQKDNLIKQQQLQQQLLLKNESDVQLSLLLSNNKLNEQQLQIKDQELEQQALLQQQKASQLTLLDKENRLKDQRLNQQSFIRNALIAGLFILLLLSVFVFRTLLLKRKNEKLSIEKKQAELQQKVAELEMQALRAQMNPHFIFNCLSSINKFILKNDTDTASDYLTRFSRLIRQVLTNSQLSLIPLSDEIEMLRLYLDMERLRFSESFNYNIIYENTIEPESIYIPPMLLQPFCENAIWHGLMHKEGKGILEIMLSIQKGELQCIIADNGIGRGKAAELKSKSGTKQKSFGLKITTERLALFNNEKTIHSFYNTEDVMDEKGNIEGTKVILNIKFKNNVHQPVQKLHE